MSKIAKQLTELVGNTPLLERAQQVFTGKGSGDSCYCQSRVL